MEVSERSFLIQSRQERCDGSRFSTSTQIEPAVLNRTQRTENVFLDDAKLRRYADRRNARQSHDARRKATAPRRVLKSPTVTQGISLCLMDLHQHFFLILVLDRLSGYDVGPVKSSEIVKVTFGLQQFSLAQWSARLEGSVSPNETLPCMLAPQIRYRTNLGLRALLDEVSYRNAMGIIGNGVDRRFEAHIQVSQIQVTRDNLISILV